MKKENLSKFLSILFDKDEKVCVGEDFKATNVVPVDKVTQGRVISINPLTDKRGDENVTKLRSFLIEIDDMPLESQQEYIDSLGMPYSTKVFSGNKSYHYVITLEHPLDSREMYNFFFNWIQSIVSESDPSTGNPSRFTRLPDAHREGTNKLQTLVEAKRRITHTELAIWLRQYMDKKPMPKEEPKKVTLTNYDRGPFLKLLDWWVKDFCNTEYSDYGSTKVQCPVCFIKGRDSHKDNLDINGPMKITSCFADRSHDKRLFEVLTSLYEVYGTENT